jgi:hypothetical protein
MVGLAKVSDLVAIADLNVEAYREFAVRMSPDDWRDMEASLRAIEARAQSTRFLVIRDQRAIVGSVGYCPAGKGDPEIFSPDWAAVLLLAVNVIGLFTSELMTAAQQLYESLGFRRESEIPSRRGLRYWRYKLPLAEPVISVCGMPNKSV